MYHYVRNPDFLAGSYPYCARLVNQLVQRLGQLDISSRMVTLGNRKRGFIAQKDNEPVSIDFYLVLQDVDDYHPHALKEQVIDAFNEVLDRNWLPNCEDKPFGIVTKEMQLPGEDAPGFRISLTLISIDSRNTWHRLLHFKTERFAWDEWYWCPLPYSRHMTDMEYYLKARYFRRVRKAYLEQKSHRRERNGSECASLIAYLHALRQIYAYALEQEATATEPISPKQL